MRKLIFPIGIFFLTGCATFSESIFTPSQIERYCRQLVESSGGNNQVMETCIQQELGAKDRLSRMSIPSQIERYCRQLSESTGGSYQVMETCIQQKQRY